MMEDMARRRRPDDGPSAHEAGLAREGRRSRLGAWYTPEPVVHQVLDLALDPVLAATARRGPEAVAALRVLDPACGSGNFLVAAAERIALRLSALGVSDVASRATAARCVAGVDVDPRAVELARAALHELGGDGAGADHKVVVADALALDPPPWRAGDLAPLFAFAAGPWGGLLGPTDPHAAGFDVVVGNPPFLGRLRRATAPDARQAEALRRRFGGAAGAYTDGAALFLLLATELARPDGGTVALVLPRAVLASRDCSGVRRDVLDRSVLRHLWVGGDGAFDADVAVCVPVLVLGGVAGPVQLWPQAGADGPVDGASSSATAPAPHRDGRPWSDLLAAAAGLPDRLLATAGTLGDLATATADFRDQYYGLVGHVVDAPEVNAATTGARPRLVTAGLIDPAHLRWGEQSARFAKQRFAAPVVVVEQLDPALQDWARQRLVPKVVLATQTRVLEAVVDAAAHLLPSVPVISVVPRTSEPDVLWRIGALLTSPPVTLVAARRHLGAGRNGDALRLRAAEVLDLPLPSDEDDWAEGARAFRQASQASDADERRTHLVASAAAMTRAFGLGDDQDLLAWWTSRLPRRDRVAAPGSAPPTPTATPVPARRRDG